MTAFPDNAALDYDHRIQTLIPGYSLALSLMGLKLSQVIQLADKHAKPLRILIVGCGTGSEILTIAPILPNAHFYALEPSKGMLDIAQQRLKAANLLNRVTFIHGFIDDCAQFAFDVISLSLVLHFIAPNEKKLFLQKLSDKIIAGGSLVMFNAQLDDNDGLLKNWLTLHHDENTVKTIMTRINTKWSRLSYYAMVDLLKTVNFSTPSVFYQASCFQLSISSKTTY